ncbi:hypoxanthine phosphoribosyltransferase [Tissierella creatinophila DSM 6911]|uniref:Hypoxanthine phosphoribosyltransferase n=1 Tax=Tissierella creatinophila DSM 6911 TaxID=1123403 RepID=A0A1U7M555_TISCR|nr:hypoxanthine phosphoribosyltransferase [Tissierella creatinophila DSM 6911]
MLTENKREKTLFTREEISSKVKELGEIITSSYEDKDLVIVSLLRGSFIFAADLIREIDMPIEIDFITTSSYGYSETTTGVVNIVHDLRTDIEGKDILIVDDIIDTGFTLLKVIEHLKEKNPKSIKTCVMLDKPSRRKVELAPDFCGFTIPDVFIVGYGLNYGVHYRNIPYIFKFE